MPGEVSLVVVQVWHAAKPGRYLRSIGPSRRGPAATNTPASLDERRCETDSEPSSMSGSAGSLWWQTTKATAPACKIRRSFICAMCTDKPSPILTYGGKACKKSGVKPNKHGIIYQRGHKARLLDKEPKLGFAPVRVEMQEEGERLSKESRVNYSKLITVEHNVSVFFIGSVVPSDWDIVSEAVNLCWNEKTHHKKKFQK